METTKTMKTSLFFLRFVYTEGVRMTMRHIITGLSLLILAGCVFGSRSPQNGAGTIMPYATPSTYLSSTKTGSSTTPTAYIPSTKTEPPATPTYLPSTMRNQCLEMTSTSKSEIRSLKGLVLFDQKKGDAYFWDGVGDTQTHLPLQPGGRISDPSVSPDHKYTLYYDDGPDEDENLVITDSKAKIVWTKTITPIHDLYGWFDSQRLWHSSAAERNTPSRFILVDPFSGTQQELREDLPSIQGQLDYRWWMPIAVYDPSLTRVVYAGCDESCLVALNHGGGWPVLLYNIETNKIITSLVTQDRFGLTPLWLPDGSRFIMAADIFSQDFKSYEFFSISRDGAVRQLTHLHEDFSEVEVSMNYSMSPDGNYLAFWLRVQPGPFPDGRLAVLNLQNGNITNYCISGFPFNNLSDINALSSPVWSPDGTQLVIASRNLQTPGSNRIALVDLIHGTAAQVIGMDNVNPVGWLLIP